MNRIARVIMTAGIALAPMASPARADGPVIPLGALCNGGGRTQGAHQLTGVGGLIAGPPMSGSGHQIQSGFFTRFLPVSDVSPPDALELTIGEFRPASGNPFRGEVTLRHAMKAGSRADLALFDITGRNVRQMELGPVAAGSHSVVLSCADLPSGIYFCRLQAGPESRTIRLMQLK